MFGGLAARVHPGLVLAAACWLAACCVALAWIDAVVQRLPDALTGAAYAGTAGFLLAAAAASGRWPDLLRAVLGGLALAAAYLALAVISRSALGLGDVKLAASLGTLTAWAGWPVLIAGAFAGFLLGALYGVGAAGDPAGPPPAAHTVRPVHDRRGLPGHPGQRAIGPRPGRNQRGARRACLARSVRRRG